MLSVTQVMIAMERYRLANQRWPKSLDEIPKSILPELPIDPFSGQPVCIARTTDGWTVYCVGPDGEDNGGKLDPKFKQDVKGFDWGYRLWDVDHRRMAPGPKSEAEAKHRPGDGSQ